MHKLKEYLKQKDPKFWRGMNDCEFLVILVINTPNNSIGFLWRKKGEINPLSKRSDYM